GRLDEGIAIERLAFEGNLAQGDTRLAAGSLIYLAALATDAREYALAEREARRAIAMLNDRSPLLSHARARLAAVLLATDRAREAREEVSRAMRLLIELGRLEEGDSLVHLLDAETLLAVGDEEIGLDALRIARDRLVERSERIREPTWRACFLERIPENARTLA